MTFLSFFPERTLGGLDVFLPYIYDYANTFTGLSITTEIWQKHLYGFFSANGGADKVNALDSVKWEVRYPTILCYFSDLNTIIQEWLNGEGTDLPDTIKYDTSLAQIAYDLAYVVDL